MSDRELRVYQIIDRLAALSEPLRSFALAEVTAALDKLNELDDRELGPSDREAEFDKWLRDRELCVSWSLAMLNGEDV